MKAITLAIFLSLFSLALSATNKPNPCFRTEKTKTYKLPLSKKDIVRINSSVENYYFTNNGTIPSDVHLNYIHELTFEGVQNIETHIISDKDGKVFTKGTININEVTLLDSSAIYVYNNTVLNIGELNISPKTKIYLADTITSKLYIDGVKYEFRDKYDGVVINSCDPELTLPVIFSDITSKIDNEYLTISWTVDKEVNNEEFSIFMSEDATNWYFIDKVKSKGDTNTPTTYTKVFRLIDLNINVMSISWVILILFALLLIRNKKVFLGLITICITLPMLIVSCTKSNAVDLKKIDTKYKYFYIQQIDKDGTITKTKVFNL